MCPAFRETKPDDDEKTSNRIDIASIRKQQIVEAATEIIVEQGLHGLSLSKIEKRTGMKRGQLTYYFPTKESILLAVFDQLLRLMFQRMGENDHDCTKEVGVPSAWEILSERLPIVLMEPDPVSRQFHALQFTFLAQVAHREDFRQRLASMFGEWRDGMAAHWKVTAKPELEFASHVSPRTISSFIQALIHGLGVQLAADPNAFDRKEMVEFALAMLAPLFVRKSTNVSKSRKPAEGSSETDRAHRAPESSS